jgi:hypothetical protein
MVARRIKKVPMTPRDIEKLVTDAAKLSDSDFEARYPPIGSGIKKSIVIDAKLHREWKSWLGNVDASKALRWLIAQHPSGPMD